MKRMDLCKKGCGRDAVTADGFCLTCCPPTVLARADGSVPNERDQQRLSANHFMLGLLHLTSQGFKLESLYARPNLGREATTGVAQNDIAALLIKPFGGDNHFAAVTLSLDGVTGARIALPETSYGADGMKTSGDACKALWAHGWKSGS